MQKFYDDETLGIKNEDATTNSVARGVSMPPDASIKKKEKELV